MDYGNKGNNLNKMRAHEINVPQFICLSWKELIKDEEEIAHNIRKMSKDINYDNVAELYKLSTSLQLLITDRINESLEEIDYYERFARENDTEENIPEFSVRSSTDNEDGENTSFAGQFDTYLNVSYKDISKYVLNCCKSLNKVNVLKYCGEQGISIEDLKMNVIIQEMIEPEYSGIIFTSNPQGLLNESVIVVGPGVGANVVEDRVDTTTYYYNTTDDLYYYETQSEECVILSEDRVNELIKVSKELQEIFGSYLDIEFAVRDAVLYILQARKITTIDDSNTLILDNSNIVESYPGISLPLTDSFVNVAYTGVFKGLCTRVIRNKILLESLEDNFNNMVGSCNGRMYYKISNWYTLIKCMPFRKKLIKIWQDMLGVGVKTYDDSKVKMSIFTRLSVYKNAVSELMNVQKNMDKLNEDFIEINKYFKENFSEDLSNKELVRLYENVKAKVLDNWDITLLNDMYAFIFTGLIKSMLKMDKVENYEIVVNNYISGISNIESMKPINELLQLSKLAIDKDMVGKNPCEDKEFEQAFNEYIDNYGDRALEELKIESETFRSNPDLLVEMIVSYTEDREKFNNMLNGMKGDNTELNDRDLGKACWIDRGIIKFFAKKATKGIKSREISRLNRSRLYGIVRSIVLQIGKNYQREGLLDDYRDIFYLYLDEIFDYINENNTDLDMKSLVSERKEKYKLYNQLPAYSRLVFAGESFDKNHVNINSVNVSENCDTLKGTPCSCGCVEGEVVVIDNVSETKDVKDKILVTKMTDPGWVFLLVEAKGIITEKGSLLSHTAIISRELNIPSVVGVKNVCNILKTGDRVRLNGNTGEVEVI